MSLTDSEKALIAAATAAVSSVPWDRKGNVNNCHNVGAALLTSTRQTITGINLAHYTGGYCAEIVALTNAASQGFTSNRHLSRRVINAPSIDLCVAVVWDGETAKVINPCGRCRQIMSDYWPEIEVLVDVGEEKVERKGLEELLPWGCRCYGDE